jgi:DNA helicase II / ATP-dependent DNA helicase PcrA
MAVSAVPGSGKTHTLSYLAAQLIAKGYVTDDQEVLIVTLVNSAVDNFSSRLGAFLKDEFKLLPNVGYRVRTLHGLAHDIVRERPGLVGLSEDFQIVDEGGADDILTRAAQTWVKGHPDALSTYLRADLEKRELLGCRAKNIPELVEKTAKEFIHTAKDRRVAPEQVHARLEAAPALSLAHMGCDIYTDYQRGLAYRGQVDFDDLVRLAVDALRCDGKFLERCRLRWPYILEDEAQDSNRIQEELLGLLAGPHGNWVRVGDPNQAIYETFTTANPQFFRDYKARAQFPEDLPNSGRSTESVIRLANYLIEWTGNQHPVNEIRGALVPPLILPTPPGDPQPNPPDDLAGIRIITEPLGKESELATIAKSLEAWLPEHANSTVAILVPTNARANDVITELHHRDIEYVDVLLKSTNTTRSCAGALTYLLRHLADPASPGKLADSFKVWRRDDRENAEVWARVQAIAKRLSKCSRLEEFLWPFPGKNWLETQTFENEDRRLLEEFRSTVQRWQGAVSLPIDQLVITLAQELFMDAVELATGHKLALALKRASQLHPDWQLPQLIGELEVVAQNERRFFGISAEDTDFSPENYKGKVVVATIHKAKGLEWDRVYVTGVNDYDFPSGLEEDKFRAESWFIRDELSIPAEALAQLDALLSQEPAVSYGEGRASRQARHDYVRERLRLLYVAITRARRELTITSNTGRYPNKPNQPAIPIIALQAFWKERLRDPA